jgi:hypothetical protein
MRCFNGKPAARPPTQRPRAAESSTLAGMRWSANTSVPTKPRAGVWHISALESAKQLDVGLHLLPGRAEA